MNHKVNINTNTSVSMGYRNDKGQFIKGSIPFNKGKHYSEETKRKISEVQKGKHLSKKTKKKISQALKGRKFSEEHKKKLSKLNKGRKHSEESRRNMSEAHKGQIAWNKGKKLSEEIKNKISLKIKGRKHSEETKGKISTSLKGKYIKDESSSWKGGISSLRTQIYNSYKYKEWRQQVFIRDHFTCQNKNTTEHSRKLNAHHKDISFSQLIQEAKENLPLLSLYDACMLYTPMWDINNGKTICRKCHYKLHRKNK